PRRRAPSSRQAAPFCRRLLVRPGRSSSPLRGCGRSTWTHSSTAGPTSLRPEGRKTIRRTPCPRLRLHRETGIETAPLVLHGGLLRTARPRADLAVAFLRELGGASAGVSHPLNRAAAPPRSTGRTGNGIVEHGAFPHIGTAQWKAER